MESFDRLFAPNFTDQFRSLTNTLAGFVDHATRLMSVPALKPGPLAALLAEAQAATLALGEQAKQAQQDLGLRLGTQKEATSHTAAAQAEALDRIRKNEATLQGDALVADDEERQRLYALLYPSGLKYYTAARVGAELPDRLGEYLTRTEAEKALLGAAFVQRTQQALGPYRQVRDAQVTGLANTDSARASRHALVAALDAQCDYNYHLLSLAYHPEPHRPATYWQAGYYLRPASAPTPPAAG